MNVLIDTLYYLIKNNEQVNKKTIHVSDFTAIKILDPTNEKLNTDVIRILIDPDKATLPLLKPNEYSRIRENFDNNTNVEAVQKIATLFVGNFRFEETLASQVRSGITVLEFSNPENEIQTIKLAYEKQIVLLQPGDLVKVKDARNDVNNIKEFTEILDVDTDNSSFTVKNPNGQESKRENAEASVSRPNEKNISTLDILKKINNTIQQRKIREQGDLANVKEYKDKQIKKKSQEFIRGSESEQYKRMIEESNRKDKLIEQLVKARSEQKKKASENAGIDTKFKDRLKAAFENKRLKEMEDLLKENDADLAKQYEEVKKDENNKKDGYIPIPNALKTNGLWDQIKQNMNQSDPSNFVGAKTFAENLLATNSITDEDVKPDYENIGRMISRMWDKFKKKPNNANNNGNNNGKRNKNRNRRGGTLREYFRSSRRTVRRV
jgi:hypothetical protein